MGLKVRGKRSGMADHDSASTDVASTVMSVATLAYGVFALVRPRHLGDLVTTDDDALEAYDDLARVFGVRDIVTSLVVLLGPSPAVRTAGMAARIAFDAGDGILLTRSSRLPEGRRKLAIATSSWAALNLAALLIDRRRR